MKNLFLLILIAISCKNDPQKSHYTATKESIDTSHNNNELTKNWHVFNSSGIGSWTNEDGVFYTPGGSGDLITNEVYDDFRMEFEWKLDTLGNSGVFFNVLENPQKYNTVYETGPEFQLLDDLRFPNRNPKQLTGSNYDMIAPTNSIVKPIGSWNMSTLTVIEDSVTHEINEIIVLKYILDTDEWHNLVANSKWKDFSNYGSSKSGKIALQDHGGPVWFRNIKITRL